MAVGYRRFLPSVVAIIAVLCSLASPRGMARQSNGQNPQDLEHNRSSIIVSVRLPDGTAYDLNAVVNLNAFTGASAGIGALRGGHAEFDNLPIGRYTVEVTAPGYQKTTEQVDISIGGQREQVFVTLTAEASGNPAPANPGPPILAPDAQKESNRVLEALRANKPEEARKHLEKLSRVAPANPDVNYLWGMYYLQSKDSSKAKGSWEQAIQIYPRHAFSLSALALLAFDQGDVPGAIEYLGRAVEAAPTSWRYQERLAEAYLRQKDYSQAQLHAERAIELGKDRANQAQLILAKALIRQNESQRAQKALHNFLTEQPSGPPAVEAQRLLDALQQPAATTASVPPLVFPAPPPNSGAASVVADLVPAPKWMPPDIDDSMPAVEPGATCSLEMVQEEAGKRVRDFVDSVNRISATESLEDETIDRFGFPVRRESRTYSYVASLEEIRPGMFNVEEYRNGTMALDVFPERLATIGLSSLIMVFHPNYRDDFQVTCEGLSRWHGGLAWQVRFRQRPDKLPRLREYHVGSRIFPISLRGRAWIATDTFQVVSLETDMVAPVEQIRLRAEHISIEYAPVQFQAHKQQLWLPENAELFCDFGGRRIHRRHHFRDYMLFSVDEKQKISAPTIKSDSDPDSAATQPNF